MQDIITGIQQVGIGVADAEEAKLYYKALFGMDVLVFDDSAEANLMTRYTGNEVHQRRAILSLNMSGGGGFELWQFTSRKAAKPIQVPRLGDIGIFAVKIKSPDVAAAHLHFCKRKAEKVSPLFDSPDDRKHFWLTDKYGNHFNIVEGDEWFKKRNTICGGVVGVVIGVSDMQKALHYYKDVLGISQTVYSGIAPAVDVPESSHGQTFHRVLLKKEVANSGAFSKLLGAVQIELLEVKNRKPARIFEHRFWGDCGFIHVCFDVLHMDHVKQMARQAGYPFTVDSNNSFDMGNSAGRFCYVEDYDGTLTELVETHKVPIFKKLGLYFNLKKRKHDRPLAKWMIELLGLSKVR